jgi:catechol 2,3-dioxygenase-like lactoylglutathione lyase family enzyme
MKYVTGIGGIFFKAQDPEKLGEWYRKHLGLDMEKYGGVTFREGEAPAESSPRRQAYTVWSPFAADTDYFAPSEKPFMINFRVTDLDALLAQLRSEGVSVDERTENRNLVTSVGRWTQRETELSCGNRPCNARKSQELGSKAQTNAKVCEIPKSDDSGSSLAL